jgi:hypothetical protein
VSLLFWLSSDQNPSLENESNNTVQDPPQQPHHETDESISKW